MLDDKTRALLGDHEAAQRLTDAGVLIPCKCGRTPHVKQYRWPWGAPDTFGVVCDCGIQDYRFFTNKNSAIREWNTRAPILSAEEMEILERLE